MKLFFSLNCQTRQPWNENTCTGYRQMFNVNDRSKNSTFNTYMYNIYSTRENELNRHKKYPNKLFLF